MVLIIGVDEITRWDLTELNSQRLRGMNDTVSVVILTRNSARTLEKCLRSVMEQDPGEILIVDGQSADSTLDIARRFGVKVISESAHSIGFSRQLGVESVNGIYVMFVDSDVEISPGCISTLCCELERYGWAGIHAKVRSKENVSYWQKAEDDKFRQQYASLGPIDQIQTMAALFRRAVLLEYPFDPQLKESSEDVDLSRRLVLTNHRLGVSSSVAYHLHRPEFCAFARQRFSYGLGSARMYTKYGSVRIILDPLVSAFSRIIRSLPTRRIVFVPYWAADGVIRFAGVVAGLVRARQR